MNWSYYGNRTAYVGLLDELLHPPPSVVAVDIETISLKTRVPIGLSIAVSPTDAFYFPMLPSIPNVFPWHILCNPAITKVYHNALFDLSAMAIMNYSIDETNIGDTSVIAHLLNLPAQLQLFAYYVDMEIETAKEMLSVGKNLTMLDIPEDKVAIKCCKDAQATLALYNKYIHSIDRDYYNVEIELIPILSAMSRRGLLIDHQVRSRIENRLEDNVAYYRELADAIGFNPASPTQVGYILAKRGNFLPFTKSRKQLRADESTLKKLEDPVAALVLKFREENYLLTHYIRPWAESERAYTHFHLDAITGRVSSTDRNMQNIPKGETRNMFLPDSGVFTDIDFSQLELRVFAYLTQDKKMLHTFESGGDIHQATADYINIDRYIAKSVNFAIIFGATDETVAETAEVTIERARSLLSKWMMEYREAGDWIVEQQREALRTGYVTTLYGRRIALPIGEERESKLKRKAINYPTQGSAAEIVKRAMLKMQHMDLRLQVHDELVIDGEVVIPHGLDNISPIYTPYTINYLERWE